MAHVFQWLYHFFISYTILRKMSSLTVLRYRPKTNLRVFFQDWEAATGMVYPMTFFHTLEKGKAEVQPPRDLFTEENFIKFKRDWGDKVISM